MTSKETTTLAALLPIKVSGRHYGENLARLDMLFSSLVHFAAPGLLDEIVVVARADEADCISRFLAGWPDLHVRLVVEDDYFPAFQRYNRPWQVRPWQRQQIIKLHAPALTDAHFVLTLDPDVLAVKPLRREDLVSGGRAILEPEGRLVHHQWWTDSARLLEVDPALERAGMSVTPALLSTAVLRELQGRLEAIGGRPWMDVLLTSYCDWTEYTLYLLAAERTHLLDRMHRWPDDPATSARLQVDPRLSIWTAAQASSENVKRLLTADQPGLFAVVQSGSGMPASEVSRVLAAHFPVRHTDAGPMPASEGRSKARERLYTASRLTATLIYRARRRLREHARRGTRSPEWRPSPRARERGVRRQPGSPQVDPPSMR
jgi:hypothetical protein